VSATELAARIEGARKRVEAAALRAGRDPATIEIIAVSKRFPAELILEAVACGVRVFGENRVQEASEKIPAITEASPVSLEWHLVGQLQRNKAARAVELFSVIHSVDRPELADAIARAAAREARRIRVLLQINLENEPQKAGVEPGDAAALLAHVDALSELEVVGLMTLPRPREDPEEVRPAFARLRGLRDELNAGRPPERGLRILSMGMSNDFEVAIEEGADWVRIGTAIFGERDGP
jgi:pyridoxal phosphate enzyme (YggS family)